ncbi:g7546 [Coccomyxa elongata]
MAAPRMTGLQRQVIHLYRRILRHTRTRSSDERDTIMTHARKEFERYRNVDKKNYQLIEHLLRKGDKQLSLISQSDVSGIRIVH